MLQRLVRPPRLSGALDNLLFRRARIDAGEIVLGRKRIYVLPTSAGIGFTVALLVMLVASINYNLSLGYAVVFLLGGVGVVSMIHAFRNLLGLRIAFGRSREVFAGEAAVFPVLLCNDDRRARPDLSVAADGAPIAVRLGEHGRLTVELPRATARRGWLPLGRVTITTLFPLGLVRAWCVLKPDVRCLVYPRPEASAPPVPESGNLERGAASARNGNDDFSGLKAYEPSHSPKHIAWKVVARGGPMLTKQFSGLEGEALEIDWHQTPSSMDTEARLSRLTAWVLQAAAQERPFSLRLPGGFIETDSGQRHFQAVLRQLALFGSGDRNA